MSGGFRRLSHWFIEAVPDPGAPAAPAQRLTRFAQVLLGSAVGLLGIIVYGSAWTLGEVTASRLEICPVLGQDRTRAVGLDSMLLDAAGESPNMLLWNYRLNRELIAELKPATRPQRLLLNQQIANLTSKLSRQCYLVRYYRIQAGALAALSTGAAVVLVLVGLAKMPRGLGSVTRCEQALATSSLVLLMISTGYLTLGDQQRQMHLNWGYYKRGVQLFSLIRSSLATNQLLLPSLPSVVAGSARPIPLDSPGSVGLLVARIDAWLLTVDQVSVALDDSFARHTVDELFQSKPGAVASPEPSKD
ncbi:MAG: hypothetical protein VKO65_02370 [Cyanobacteriota bacterium]|nr:hypothetical protein [Cyanobacteriota bacterium]